MTGLDAGRVGRPHGLDGSFHVTRPDARLLAGLSEILVDGVPRRIERRAGTPERPIFRLERARLETKVHQRVNVRILELIHKDTGSSVQLEGNRIPLLHTKDVIKALHGDG